MSLAGVGGTIGTIVGLGITVAALGLAFEFAGQAIERTKPKSQRRKGPIVFDSSLPKGRGSVFNGGSRRSTGRNNSVFNGGSRRSTGRRNSNLFDPMGSAPRRRNGSKRKNDLLGGDFF